MVNLQLGNVATCAFFLKITGFCLAGDPRGIVRHRLHCDLANPKEIVLDNKNVLNVDGMVLQVGQQLFLGTYVTKNQSSGISWPGDRRACRGVADQATSPSSCTSPIS